MLIVMLVFLVYIGVWYLYMNDFMNSVQVAMERLESTAYADEIQHNINVMCSNGGALTKEFSKGIEVSGSGDEVYVNGIKRSVGCTVEVNIAGNTSKIKMSKDNGKVVLE